MNKRKFFIYLISIRDRMKIPLIVLSLFLFITIASASPIIWHTPSGDVVVGEGDSLWTNESFVATYNGAIEIDGIRNNNNYISEYYTYDIPYTSDTSGIGNIISLRGGCIHEGTSLEWLCLPPYNMIGNSGHLNVTGNSNIVAMKLGSSMGEFDNDVSGNANYLGGINNVGYTSISGNGNTISGTGGFNVTGDGNLVIGNLNEVTADGSISVGQYHTTTGDYCANFGAQNVCGGIYATTLGYGVDVFAGTSLGAGKDITITGLYSQGFGTGVNVTASKVVAFGRYVTETNQELVTIGNGLNGYSNRDIIISADLINITKETRFEDKLYYKNKLVDRTNDVVLSSVDVTNTVVETLLWTGDVPANSLEAGNVFKFYGVGIVSNVLPNDEITLRVKVGGVTKITLVNSGRTFSDDDFHIDAMATQRTLGASGSRAMHVDMSLGEDSSSLSTIGNIDTTNNMDITITAQWNNAKAGNTLTFQQGFIEYKN